MPFHPKGQVLMSKGLSVSRPQLSNSFYPIFTEYFWITNQSTYCFTATLGYPCLVRNELYKLLQVIVSLWLKETHCISLFSPTVHIR